MSQELAVILDAIREYNKKYALVENEVNDIPTEDEEDDEFKSVDEKVNYEKYRVNEEVAYNLSGTVKVLTTENDSRR